MKKQMSLRQLAKELGVSASYLSQIKNGKRPASSKFNQLLQNHVQSVKQSVKQNPIQSVKILSQFTFGGVSELADEHDLGSCAARRRGSSPLFPSFLLVDFSVLQLLKSVQEVFICPHIYNLMFIK